MPDACTLQLHCHGSWQDVATITLFGEQREGWRARTYSGYAVDWAVQHPGQRDAHALSCQFPVGLEPLELGHWPVFLIDMLPQGYGREELLRRIALPATATEEVDWRLLLAGGGNPVGNLRVKEAAQWLQQDAGPLRGFTDDEVAARGEDFAEYLAANGLFVAGSSGVQGEWPKILLTRAEDGLLYLDHSLPDERAREHYIVKFGRGTNERLAAILRLEAPYMALAQRLQLRVHAPLLLKERALFIRRFDRTIQGGRTVRLGQESIATLAGLPGFGALPSHEDVCRALIARCSRPEEEVVEYVKRDIANIALGNKDNHARNTAVQRDFQGNIRLAPVYDFAPMYLHPDGIARRIRWQCGDGGSPDWQAVIDAVCAMGDPKARPSGRGKPARPVIRREFLLESLRAMAAPLQAIAAHGTGLGVDEEVIEHLRPGILAQARQLQALK